MKGKIFNAQEVREAKNTLRAEIDRLRINLKKPKEHKKGYSSRELDEWSNYYDIKYRINYYKDILRRS